MQRQKFEQYYLDAVENSPKVFARLKEGDLALGLNLNNILSSVQDSTLPLGFAGIVTERKNNRVLVSCYDLLKPCYDVVLEDSEIARYNLRINVNWVVFEGLSKACLLFENNQALDKALRDFKYHPSSTLIAEIERISTDKKLIE
jgi:hypothetical protein